MALDSVFKKMFLLSTPLWTQIKAKTPKENFLIPVNEDKFETKDAVVLTRMSSLFEWDIQRQFSTRSKVSVATITSTVASYAVKDPDFENSENSTEPNESSFRKEAVNAYFEGCQNVKIGDEINHVHNNFGSQG